MKLLCLIFFGLTVSTSFSQDTLSRAFVNRFAYTFELDSVSIRGPGWDSLQQDIKRAQFIMLGENHSSPLLSFFTKHLLNAAAKSGFDHFLLETGPVASRKLASLYSPDEKVFGKRLHDFLSEFKMKAGSPPAEFIAMKNDVTMYAAAFANKYKVIGLDKEYASSVDYLLNELGRYSTKGLKAEYDAALLRAAFHKKMEVETDNYPHITESGRDTVISRFLDHVAGENKDARFIVDELRKSFLIYGLNEGGQYYQSEEVRLANVKKNFGQLYYKYPGGPSGFKAIVKFGNVHAERGISYYWHFDVGNLLTEIAASNGNTSLHIHGMRRYRYREDGTVADFYNDGYEVYPNIISQTDSTKWTVIDLRPMRLLILSGKMKVKSKQELDLIVKNDLVLLTPVDGAYRSSMNYE
ncbi:hypothetical protein LZZ85_01465 [Terrimonas sp. NA20]|uniref:Haem-binding uptake Tiki superfamily ChaN domain-containing protein n=1 Tax=Terrimonas ginsenosidimutans TaxID=2908004 RepID=A0ABS9KKS6_9BACT|nr:hypothetical protein [Terrimonas ginsenosidimutans]MCG2612920.1 hypothetical protein [Terrimonas ginsenosidimutans]